LAIEDLCDESKISSVFSFFFCGMGPVAIADVPQAAPAPTATSGSRLVILGTAGGPYPHRFRSQPANLLIVNGKAYLIDAGDGVVHQIISVGYHPAQVAAVFLTHLHLDHTAGIGPFMAFDWVDRRRAPVPIYGPPGTEELVSTALAHFHVGERIFAPEFPGYPSMASLFQPHDVDLSAPREIYKDDNLRVVAVENSHYSTMQLPAREYGTDRSYSLRFEMKDRTIVFTGDSGPSANLEHLAAGADILVSEVVDIPAILATIQGIAHGANAQPLIEHMYKEHLTPEEVGKLATKGRIKMVVLTHFAGPEGPDTSGYVNGVRQNYQGMVVAAQDLDAF
jgi:ribonuclease BN (tRNA processing enzyme)